MIHLFRIILTLYLQNRSVRFGLILVSKEVSTEVDKSGGGLLTAKPADGSLAEVAEESFAAEVYNRQFTCGSCRWKLCGGSLWWMIWYRSSLQAEASRLKLSTGDGSLWTGEAPCRWKLEQDKGSRWKLGVMEGSPLAEDMEDGSLRIGETRCNGRLTADEGSRSCSVCSSSVLYVLVRAWTGTPVPISFSNLVPT